MDVYFQGSILAVDFLLFRCFICDITRRILRLNIRANILRMLQIMLLSHVEIHICHL
jgi:hypothetical protein